MSIDERERERQAGRQREREVRVIMCVAHALYNQTHIIDCIFNFRKYIFHKERDAVFSS